jgi:hypothetical protein
VDLQLKGHRAIVTGSSSFVASPLAGNINSANLRIDGGSSTAVV